MKIPSKFKHLIDLNIEDVDHVDCAWIAYAVCACEKDSCGWQGWILDGVFKKEGNKETLVASSSPAECPNCGKSLFRTGIQLRLVPSIDQAVKMIPGIDYEVGDIGYIDQK